MRCWSFYTTRGEPTYDGHQGYDDRASSHYSWDSAVPNHAQVSVGDLGVIRDSAGSIGVAFLERIVTSEGLKERRRCPECRTSQLDERTRISPPWRCTNGHVFETPVFTTDPVTLYRAEYERAYLATNAITAAELEALSLARAKQNAIRELELDKTIAKLRQAGVSPSFTALVQ